MENQVTVMTESEKLQLMQKQADAQFALTAAGQMVRTFETTQRIGKMYADSTIVPKAYQNNVANCAIAVDVAMHLGRGLSPLTVMQNLVIVEGTPTWHAPFLVACINATEKYTPIDYDEKNLGKIGKDAKVRIYTWENGKKTQKVITTDEYADVDNLSCAAFAFDLATGNKKMGSTITIKMAMEEGWYARNGSKWQTMPQQMLKYRAASYWQRAFEPGVAMGFHTTEEIQDSAPQDSSWEEIKEPQTSKSPQEIAMEEMKAKKAKRATQEPVKPVETVIYPEAETEPKPTGIHTQAHVQAQEANPQAEKPKAPIPTPFDEPGETGTNLANSPKAERSLL